MSLGVLDFNKTSHQYIISYDEYLLISPYQHQIHHSDNPKHFNKNMGSKLAIWDWMFGTLVLSKSASKMTPLFFGNFFPGMPDNDFTNFLNVMSVISA